MAAGGFKADPTGIIRAHRLTYVSTGSSKLRWQDSAVFEWLPVAAGVLCLFLNFRLSSSASTGLLTVCGLLSVFLFTVVVQLWARATDLADSWTERGPVSAAQADSLGDLTANASYAALVCIFSSVVFLIAGLSTGWTLRISSGLGVAGGLHLILVIMMVMKRVFIQTQLRLRQAQAGADKQPTLDSGAVSR